MAPLCIPCISTLLPPKEEVCESTPFFFREKVNMWLSDFQCEWERGGEGEEAGGPALGEGGGQTRWHFNGLPHERMKETGKKCENTEIFNQTSVTLGRRRRFAQRRPNKAESQGSKAKVLRGVMTGRWRGGVI